MSFMTNVLYILYLYILIAIIVVIVLFNSKYYLDIVNAYLYI